MQIQRSNINDFYFDDFACLKGWDYLAIIHKQNPNGYTDCVIVYTLIIQDIRYGLDLVCPGKSRLYIYIR